MEVTASSHQYIIHLSTNSRNVINSNIDSLEKNATFTFFLLFQFEDHNLVFRILKISGRLSLFPYWTINQPTKEKYATRKQPRFRWIKNLAVKYLSIQGISGCRILKTVMAINEVEKPVISPAITSHLQNMALSLLEYQESNIFVHLTVE